MQTTHLKSTLAVFATLAAATLTLNSAHAQTVTLNGGWAPFTRCPVTNSAMEATDGVNTESYCADNSATGGTLKMGTMGVIQLGPIGVGNAPVPAGASDLQFGFTLPTSSVTLVAATTIPPASGAVLAAPVQVPGGLLGLICPSSDPVITQVCDAITDNSLNEITATLESAGAPTNFSVLNAGMVGQTIVTLPVKILLSGSLLGSGCYIGSDQNPILLHPQNTVVGSLENYIYDLNGAADPNNGLLETTVATGVTQVDTTFSVPGANGCNALNIPFSSILVDPVIDLKVGLPASSGNNSLTLTGVTEAVINEFSNFSPVTGAQFAAGWQSAVVSQ